ncbi:hypothetical protein PVAP13_3KG108127, partial [Panicum virgatum]
GGQQLPPGGCGLDVRLVPTRCPEVCCATRRAAADQENEGNGATASSCLPSSRTDPPRLPLGHRASPGRRAPRHEQRGHSGPPATLRRSLRRRSRCLIIAEEQPRRAADPPRSSALAARPRQ